MRKSTFIRWVTAVMLCGGSQAFAQTAAEFPETAADIRGEMSEDIRQILQGAYQAFQLERFDRAEALFQQALTLDPANRRARFGLGTLYIKVNLYREAVRYLEPLMEDFPDDYSIKNNLAWIYATATDAAFRDSSRAIELAQSAVLIEPRDFHVWSTLSEAHFLAGNYARALRAAQEAERLSRQLGASPEQIQIYTRQVQRSRQAAQALSILE